MKIIETEKLYIAGITGDGAKTGEVWNVFDNRYKTSPVPKKDDNWYEIRFWESRFSGVKPEQDKSVHVGIAAEKTGGSDNFTVIELPGSEYAVFEVYVANGYDSGNEEMERWLADNKFLYRLREFDGCEYVVECYDEKFKGGTEPDSIVEIWLPVFRFCQSCYMPMLKKEDSGTVKNGDYCKYCYKDGDFTVKQTLEEAVAGNIQFWREEGDKSDDEAKKRILDVFPNLKRWAK